MVAEQLPDTAPTKAIDLKYRDIYQKTIGTAANDGFAPYAFDCYLILLDAAKRAMATAKPGTPEFRSALRDAIYATKELVGTHGVYSFDATKGHTGTDRRALVLVKLTGGQWKFYK
jgi:branched-chain amino acid transport system substrate-binding protein